EQDSEDERVERRRHQHERLPDPHAAAERDGQKQQRQHERLARRGHLRSRNTRAGLKSEASTRVPPSSSAFNSSAVCMRRSGSSTTSRSFGASAIARSTASRPSRNSASSS